MSAAQQQQEQRLRETRVQTQQGETVAEKFKRLEAEKQEKAAAEKEAGEQEQNITGRVAEIRKDEVIVSRPGQPPLRLHVNPETTVNINGQRKSTNDLRNNMEVTVTYKMVNDQPVAIRFEHKMEQKKDQPRM
ncbi:MAG: hypothetical protein AB2A00_34630 [Myxococcota bacterium]